MSVFKCKMCGGSLEILEDSVIGTNKVITGNRD